MWLLEWGQRPKLMEEAKVLVEEHVKKAPRLIPIYGQRMMPDRPHLTGNPILRFTNPTSSTTASISTITFATNLVCLAESRGHPKLGRLNSGTLIGGRRCVGKKMWSEGFGYAR